MRVLLALLTVLPLSLASPALASPTSPSVAPTTPSAEAPPAPAAPPSAWSLSPTSPGAAPVAASPSWSSTPTTTPSAEPLASGRVDHPPTLPLRAAIRRVPRPHVVFYGWQSMIVGELGVGLAAAGLVLGSAKVAVPGMLIYAAGAPAIHAIHGSESKAWGAVALHTGLPLLGAGIGALAAANLRRNPGSWAVWGLGIGVLSAPIADGLFLGWKTERGDERPHHARVAPTFALAPALDGRSGSFALGAAGTF